MERSTVQRQIILAALQKMNTHPAIEEVYTEIKKEHPAISKTTVYRNLRQLAKEGIIRQVSLPDGLERYDRLTAQHYHFKCLECDGIYDVEIEYLKGIDGKIKEKYGFKVDRHDVVFTGVCLKCNKKLKTRI
ncbi:MAG: transcriptional repressor [Treponema sp.]|nr:transcriptional repressor [Treponema sp.]